MGRLVLAVYDRCLDMPESRIRQKMKYFRLGKAQPDVGVKVAGLLVIVAQEIEHHDASAGLQNPVSFGHGALRMLGVMQGLAEKCEVDGSGANGDLFDIAVAVFEIV